MALRIGAKMPPLSGARQWIGEEVVGTELNGTPVLVHFWSVGCGLCKDQMPAVRRMMERFSDHGLRGIAVHVPRLEAERDVEDVRRSMQELGMTEPCAVDNDYVITRRYENQFVPAYFLFDEKGSMRARAAGAQGASIMRTALERMFSATV